MQPASRTKIVRKTTTELAADAMRDRILSGEFPPGTALRQELLADELGVSRIPIREALRLLSAEGLVDTVPHKGAFVTMLSKAEVREFFDIRKRLEPWIFREAIPNISEADLQRAEKLVQEMVAIEPGQWGAMNWALHENLYRAAGRPAALGMVRALHEKSERYFRFQVVNAPIRQQAHREHMEMIALCRTGQVERAEALLEKHIDDAAQQILVIVDRLLDHTAAQAG
ncbi:GntR family transcriptional regulator [Bordetella genomosp. 13]|uniref:GntR family transcriptional regulator n=1 Tax=Bordetella genomosp. 13 TaxID=463040 RepID=UPI00119FAFC4|nr:GntR family transcriptional regulator [Bordetella genomosp. 13]